MKVLMGIAAGILLAGGAAWGEYMQPTVTPQSSAIQNVPGTTTPINMDGIFTNEEKFVQSRDLRARATVDQINLMNTRNPAMRQILENRIRENLRAADLLEQEVYNTTGAGAR